jgi:hypothetical protein
MIFAVVGCEERHTISILETVYQPQHIVLDMPLRMPTAALLNIARESPMTTLTERLAYFLAFFASY